MQDVSPCVYRDCGCAVVIRSYICYHKIKRLNFEYGGSSEMEKMKQLFASACGFFIIIGIIIRIVVVLAIIGGSIMHLLGFEYRSIGQLILFFVIVAVVGFPLELFAKAFPEAMLSLGRPSFAGCTDPVCFAGPASTIFSMAIVDYFMDSVSTTFVSVLIIGLIMAITSVKDIGKSKS